MIIMLYAIVLVIVLCLLASVFRGIREFGADMIAGLKEIFSWRNFKRKIGKLFKK